MLTPEQKQAWIAALRSGKYSQGTGDMKADFPDGRYVYCPLGVLYDILHGNWHYNPVLGTYSPVKIPGASSWHLFDDSLLPEHIPNKLVALNDVQGASFHNIADWIEQNV